MSRINEVIFMVRGSVYVTNISYIIPLYIYIYTVLEAVRTHDLIAAFTSSNTKYLLAVCAAFGVKLSRLEFFPLVE